MGEKLPEGPVTVMFTDVEASTELSARLGDEAGKDVLLEHHDLVRAEVARHRGKEIKALGDGLMVAFASARRAVACAVAIQRAGDESLRVKIGLNTGELVQEEGDLYGTAVNAAARIAAKAKGGEILAADVVRQLVGTMPEVRFVDRGRFRLKGFPDRWRLFEVAWQEEKAAAPAPTERTEFVGREEEKAELIRLLDQAAAGRGALVMIGGEPGIGKTRLTEEVAAEARRRGALALSGRCYEMEGGPPYVPFLEMTESVARIAPPEAFREALGEDASEVARLMPELRRIFPDIPPPLRLPPEQERHFMFNSLRNYLERSSRIQPLVLTLDDLHWADESTLLLVEHIAQRLGETAILALGTYRDVELDVSRPLARALENLVRRRLAHRLSLRPLSEESVGAMLRGLGGPDPPPSLVKAVYHETEGNPFFVEEVFAHLVEEGRLFDTEGRWRHDLQIEELDVPESVRLVVGRRLERLSEPCHRMLTTAAVIGRGFGFELLEALGEVEGDALLDAVDEAERAQLVTTASKGPEVRFTFAHELIRQTLIGGISLPRRQRMHLRVAEAMEKVYASSLLDNTPDIAHHLFQAGAAAEAEKTVRYLQLAGDLAMQAAAFEEALRYYEDALSIHPSEDEAGIAALAFKVGFARRSLGRWEEALAAWNEALTAYERLGDTEAIGRMCRGIAYQLAWEGRNEAAVEMARRGLAALEDRKSADRGRMLSVSGMALAVTGAYDASKAAIDEALVLADDLSDERLLAEALSSKVVLHWAYLQPREAVAVGLRASEMLRARGNLWGFVAALPFVGQAYTIMGLFEEAARIEAEAGPLARRLGHLGAVLVLDRMKGVRNSLAAGDLRAFEDFLAVDHENAAALGREWISQWRVWVGLLDFWRGRWEEGLTHLREAATEEVPGAPTGLNLGILLACAGLAGSSGEVLAAIERQGEGWTVPGKPRTSGEWTAMSGAAEALALLGEKERATALYPVLLELLDGGAASRIFDCRLIEGVAGLSAAAGDRWEEAERHFETALQQARHFPLRIEQAEVRRLYAHAYAERDPSRARALLTEAIDIYRDVGMPRHVERASEMLHGLG